MERVWMLGVVGDGGIVVAMVSVGTFFGEGGMVDKMRVGCTWEKGRGLNKVG
jgi:hypothetical protein